MDESLLARQMAHASSINQGHLTTRIQFYLPWCAAQTYRTFIRRILPRDLKACGYQRDVLPSQEHTAVRHIGASRRS